LELIQSYGSITNIQETKFTIFAVQRTNKKSNAYDLSIKRVFFVAASAFGADHKNKSFGYVLNTSYCLWDPLPFAFKPQDNKRQLQAAFF
jgi:hypothetical protein